MKLNVYDDSGKEVIKVLEADIYDLRFGTIRKLMKLIRIEKIENTAEILNVVCSAWDEIIKLLDTVFTNATEEDWDNIKVKELIPVIIEIGKYAISEALSIPTAKN